jgi:predicted permease
MRLIWPDGAFSALRQDISYALRMFRQSPGFTAVALTSLALGIGSNTAIFSLIDAVLLKRLPVSSPQELVVLARNPSHPEAGFNYPDYEFVRDHNRSYAGVIAYNGTSPVAFSAGHGPDARTQVAGVTMVSGNYFDVLGVRPALGRVLNVEDNRKEGAAPYAVLSHGFWRRAFAGDPHVVGKDLRLNGSPFTVVGVAREGFAGTELGASPDVFVPIMMIRQVNRNTWPRWNSRHMWWLVLIARLKPAVNMQQATAELNVLYDRIEKADPEHRPAAAWSKEGAMRQRAVVLPGSTGYSWLRNRIAKPLLFLMAIVAGVLLIACANVANLLLSRAAARQREIAIRLAIGAGRARLVRQMLTESVVLALLGGIAGLAFAYASIRFLLNLIPQHTFAISVDLSPDWRILMFSIGICVATGMLFGLAPALHATRIDLTPSLKGTTSVIESPISRLGLPRIDMRRTLMAVQVAVSLLLLIGTGLFVRSLMNLRDLAPGFRTTRLLMVSVDPGSSGYKGQRLRDFYDRLQQQVQKVPGVQVASLAAITPLGGSRWNGDVTIEGYQWKPNEKPYLDMNSVGPRYFETVGIPILLGRDFTDRDNPAVTPDTREEQPESKAAKESEPAKDAKPKGPPLVAIINQTMARRFWPKESAVGKRFTLSDKFKMDDAYEVVGVVEDARYFGLREATESMIYIPVWRQGADGRTLCVRTARDPKQTIEAIRRKVQEQDAGVPMIEARSMQEQMDDDLLQERLVAILSGFFGILALLLASIGLYGVIAYAVTRRTREIGIRMALGAQRAQVVGIVLLDAMVMVSAGAVVGVSAALALTRLASAFLYGMTPRDPATFILATSVLFAVTVFASYIPARRASNVDPMVALRYE